MVEDVARVAGPLRRELDGQAGVYRLAFRSSTAEVALGIPLGRLARIPVRRRARRQRLEMATTGAAALAGRAIEIERDVAELCGCADRAAVELPVEDQATAHARPEGEHDHVPGAAA